MPDFSLEREIGGRVAGVDEAGRGPWAGPVVAGAVVLEPARLSDALLRGLDDSKKLKPARREALLAQLEASSGAVLGVGVASVAEIDRLNILQATFLAMSRALADLASHLDAPLNGVLIDGHKVPPGLTSPARAVIGGDGKSLSIAAASIVAKVNRDRMMADLERAFPGYGWARNAGYGTKEHRAALARLGVTPHHRKSFAPIRKMLSREDS